MKPKILVTGADGFIGSHLTESLIQKGYKVKAFTFYNSFNSWGWLDYTSKKYLDKIEVVSGDIRDIDCVNKALKGCDLVFHLAALVGIPFSYHANWESAGRWNIEIMTKKGKYRLSPLEELHFCKLGEISWKKIPLYTPFPKSKTGMS